MRQNWTPAWTFTSWACLPIPPPVGAVFLHNTFGGFLRNVQAHYDRLEIVRPAYDKFETLPLWKLLSETVNQNARDKSPAPDLAGEVLRAVLTNTRYPATLLNGVALRIRAEREVTRGRQPS